MSRVFLLMVVLFLSGVGTARCQDAHMWDSQFGTRAQLLGGQVVGAPSDLSSTFYNPAWLALEKQSGLLLTTKTFEFYSLKTEQGFGPGTKPTSRQVTPSPSYFGGKFTTNINDDEVAVAYSYLQRVKFDYDASGIRVDNNPLPVPGGNLWFSGEAYKQVSLSEHWAGVSLAKKIGDHIYAGITPFAVLRKQNQRSQLNIKGIDDQQNFSHLYDMAYSTYWHSRLLAKLGVAFDYEPVTFGFTLTTPSLALFGDGSVHNDSSVSGLDVSGNGPGNPYLAVNYQDGLSPHFHSPFSLAVGGAYHVNNSSFYFSAEWFNKTSSFEILSPDSYQTQSNPDQTISYDISYSAKSILNWGLAVNHRFSHTFSLYGSFWTDQSIMDPNQNPTTIMAKWDLWHANIGASFTFMDIEFTSGIGYSFGSDTLNRTPYFNIGESDEVAVVFPEQKLFFKRVKFLIGFNLPFGVETSQ